MRYFNIKSNRKTILMVFYQFFKQKYVFINKLIFKKKDKRFFLYKFIKRLKLAKFPLSRKISENSTIY